MKRKSFLISKITFLKFRDSNNLNFISLYSKIKRKIKKKIVIIFRPFFIYNFLYKSYWHSFIINNSFQQSHNNYYTAIPNPDAGIGHQIANWNAGFWFAKKFGLKFAHSPFSTKDWDYFLGFGEDEINFNNLLLSGYTKIKLPLFDEYNLDQIKIQKDIIKSYSNKKIIFVAEQDQGYREQIGNMNELKNKFFNSSNRKTDNLFYNNSFTNIAIHIRRGDILLDNNVTNKNLSMRFSDNNYFINVLKNVIDKLKADKPIAIYLFSQGNINDFKDFLQFKNLNYCINKNPIDSFLHMVFADILITSKSSFSYKPALLNNGIKVCPKEFWHGYPNTDDWIMADESGELLIENLNLINE